MVSYHGKGMDEQTILAVLNGEFIHREGSPGIQTGAGLALKIARSFLRKHNSSLYIVSKPGKGSYCYFHLPAHKQAVLNQELEV